MLVTERPRSLNPSKAIAMAIFPIIVHFSTLRARSTRDVGVNLRAQKQLARKSLRSKPSTDVVAPSERHFNNT